MRTLNDYPELSRQMLLHLHTYRKESSTYDRTMTGIRGHFKYSVATFNRIIWELKGMGLVDCYKAGNCKVWYLTDKAIMKLEKEAKK